MEAKLESGAGLRTTVFLDDQFAFLNELEEDNSDEAENADITDVKPNNDETAIVKCDIPDDPKQVTKSEDSALKSEDSESSERKAYVVRSPDEKDNSDDQLNRKESSNCSDDTSQVVNDEQDLVVSRNGVSETTFSNKNRQSCIQSGLIASFSADIDNYDPSEDAEFEAKNTHFARSLISQSFEFLDQIGDSDSSDDSDQNESDIDNDASDIKIAPVYLKNEPGEPQPHVTLENHIENNEAENCSDVTKERTSDISDSDETVDINKSEGQDSTNEDENIETTGYNEREVVEGKLVSFSALLNTPKYICEHRQLSEINWCDSIMVINKK